ncbi:hypothetical protein ACHAWO_012647 [Cyclotella atomus]|jgi:uncharacterized protein YjbI with pentapeptide repeats|uniref:Pentapeptide repeat-containing protein n=1 Tax=Cyclotella atomus TaxID=382360 RepID=A0ABD3N824_9STRA
MSKAAAFIGLLLASLSPESQAFAPSAQTRVSTHLESAKDNNLAPILSTAVLSSILLFSPLPSHAKKGGDDFSFPPIDKTDTSRCTLNSSKMGQANAARDKLYDLRECSLSGVKGDEFDLSGVIMSGTDVSKASFKEAQFSKGYLRDSNFDGADFTNAIVDRASFKGSTLRGTIFKNAVLTATSFEGADVENADFTDSYIGDFDIRSLCKNPTLKGVNPTTGADTRESATCP